MTQYQAPPPEPTKPIYKSKVAWANGSGLGLVFLLEEVFGLKLEAETVAFIATVGNLALRFVTSRRITLLERNHPTTPIEPEAA